MSHPIDSIDQILATLAEELMTYDQRMVEAGAPNVRFVHKYNSKAKKAIESIIQAARIAEALDIRENIAELGTPVYFALQRIDGHISKLQKEKKNATQ